MKKVSIISLCVICCMLFGACSSNQALTIDDFGVYENGKELLKSNDFEDGSFFFGIEQDYDFKGRILETKKGIRIGSTIREVADTYKNIEIATEVIDPSLEPPMTLDEYLEIADSQVGKKSEEKWDYIVLYLLMDVNGKIMDAAEYKKYTANISEEELIEKLKNQEITSYRLNICIKDNIVSDILISTPA